MHKKPKPLDLHAKSDRKEPTKGALLVARLRGRGTVKLTTRQIMNLTRPR